MSERNEDMRSKRVVFVSNCILNANNKVREFARYPGMFSQIVSTLDKHDVGIQQMPCPEVLYAGNLRWWGSRELYDNVGFRRFCREMAKQTADYMENYEIAGYQTVAILVCDGSPTCGYTISSSYENGGGHPAEPVRSLKPLPGVYMEQLLEEMESRSLKMPPIYGLPMDNRDKTNEEIIADFDLFLARTIQK